MKKIKVGKKNLLSKNEFKTYFVEGVECKVAFENNGTKFLAPTFDDPDDGMIATHIVFAKLLPNGKTILL